MLPLSCIIAQPYLHPDPAHCTPGMPPLIWRMLPRAIIPEVARSLEVVKREIQASKVDELEEPDCRQDDSTPVPPALNGLGFLADVVFVLPSAIVPRGPRMKPEEKATSAHLGVLLLRRTPGKQTRLEIGQKQSTSSRAAPGQLSEPVYCVSTQQFAQVQVWRANRQFLSSEESHTNESLSRSCPNCHLSPDLTANHWASCVDNWNSFQAGPKGLCLWAAAKQVTLICPGNADDASFVSLGGRWGRTNRSSPSP